MELYDRLLQFTLFQGMSHADLMEVAGHTKFGFHKLAAGKRIVNEGDDCLQLLFLTHGTVRCETRNDGNAYRVEETIKAPYTLQPERLFGLNQRYTTSFKTLTPCNLFSIDKQEVLLLLETQLAELPDLVLGSKMLAPEGLFVLEHGKDYNFSANPHFAEHRAYGSVNFSLFRMAASRHAD